LANVPQAGLDTSAARSAPSTEQGGASGSSSEPDAVLLANVPQAGLPAGASGDGPLALSQALPDPAAEPAVLPRDYLRAEAGIRSWLLTHDHKRIAIMFLVVTTLALILGGTFAMLLRTKLLTPGPGFIEPVTYNRLFTLHGVVMVFMFMIPAIPAVFGNFFLPMMVGAKDLAFPRINLASFYVYLLGAALT